MSQITGWINKSVWSLSIIVLGMSMVGCSSDSQKDISSYTKTDTSTALTTEQGQSINQGATTSEGSTDTADTTGRGVTLIGDSVTVGIAPYLKEELPEITIDGKVGRQMRQAKQVIEQLSAQRNLGQHVILELGTNGPFNQDQLKNVLQSLSDRKQVILVTSRVPRGWQDEVNTTIQEIAPQFNNVTVVDWYEASTGKDDYFYPDGVHLKPSGSKYYVSLLIDALKNSH